VKILNLQRTDTVRMDTNDKTFFTDEGYLIDNPIVTRVGILFTTILTAASVRSSDHLMRCLILTRCSHMSESQ